MRRDSFLARRGVGVTLTASDEPRRRLGRALARDRPRNAALVDAWSLVHLATCAGLTLLIGPAGAFVVALLWEPVEVLLLSPVLARYGVDFGHESLRNSLMDVGFNALGVALGALVVLPRWNPLGV